MPFSFALRTFENGNMEENMIYYKFNSGNVDFIMCVKDSSNLPIYSVRSLIKKK